MVQLGAIFDMDGVLVDSYHAHFQSWRQLADNHGLQITEEHFAATFGKTTRQIILELWPHACSNTDIRLWDAEKETIYREVPSASFSEMDGASDLLRDLHAAGFVLGIGSSGPPQNVEIVLRKLPGAQLILASVNGLEVERGKPAPDVFLKTAEKLGLAPLQCAVVEDAPVGVEAAHRAGMPAIGLAGTVPAKELTQADLLVHSLRELTPQMIANLIRANLASRRSGLHPERP